MGLLGCVVRRCSSVWLISSIVIITKFCRTMLLIAMGFLVGPVCWLDSSPRRVWGDFATVTAVGVWAHWVAAKEPRGSKYLTW